MSDPATEILCVLDGSAEVEDIEDAVRSSAAALLADALAALGYDVARPCDADGVHAILVWCLLALRAADAARAG